MKSIKEIAEEYSRCIASSEYTKEDFVSGANYVLEQVDYILVDKDLDCEEICDKLIALVEQLKKK